MPGISQYDNDHLFQQIARGDESAFRQLYEQEKQRIYSFAYYLTHSELLAEEITQEIFIKLWTHRNELININYFASWIKTLVRNQTYTYLSRLAHEKIILKEIEYRSLASDIVTETTVIENEYKRLLQQAILQLPPQQKKVYMLSRGQGLKNEAIAATLGLSVNTVKNHLKASLKSIRGYLNNHTDALVVVAMALFFKD